MTNIKPLMDKKYLLVSLLILTPVIAHAQVADQTVGGIIVPKVTSTQSSYCSTGHCGTGTLSKVPSSYLQTDRLPILIIDLSQTCETMIKYNMKGCPSVKDLMIYDNSNQMISGKFIDNNGVITRTYPQMKNNLQAYAYSKYPIICVECFFDLSTVNKIQQIIIQPNSFSYVNKTESESKNTFYNFYGRYVEGCQIATIANLPGLLNDTIHYMLSGCVKTSTNFNGTQTHVKVQHPFSYNNPYSTLNQVNYLNNIFHGHSLTNTDRTSGGYGPADCIRHQCIFIDPYKKAGY